MLKSFTSLKKTDVMSSKKTLDKSENLQPSAKTIHNILQFAASYRAEITSDNQTIEWFLN